ncbi:hypothetical protein D3C81_1589550 [compost metagenome]
MRHPTPLEQFAVAREHDAALLGGNPRDLAVFEMIVVERVEAGHAQQVRQAAQVGIGNETGLAQWLIAHAEQGRDVERLEGGIDGHAVAVLQGAVERHRFAIDQDQLHLGVRHAERLDHVLDRGRAGAGHDDVLVASGVRQEIVQLLVEAEGGGDGGGNHGAQYAPMTPSDGSYSFRRSQTALVAPAALSV